VRLAKESRVESVASYDVAGALTGTAGLFALVFGFSRVPDHGWDSTIAVTCFIASAVLVAMFLLIESRARSPLLPLSLLRDLPRQGVLYSFLLFFGFGVAQLPLLTLHVQETLGQTAIQAGLSFMPFTIGAGIGTVISSRIITRVGPRPLLAAGCLIGAVGMVIEAQIGTESHFTSDILPGTFILGIGTGVLLPAGMGIAMSGVADDDSGILGGLINASQQVGISIGVAVLNSVATTTTSDYLTEHGPQAIAQALVEGFTLAFLLVAVAMVLASVIAAVLTRGAAYDREARAGFVA
jgi:fucose permease